MKEQIGSFRYISVALGCVPMGGGKVNPKSYDVSDVKGPLQLFLFVAIDWFNGYDITDSNLSYIEAPTSEDFLYRALDNCFYVFLNV